MGVSFHSNQKKPKILGIISKDINNLSSNDISLLTTKLPKNNGKENIMLEFWMKNVQA